MDFTISLNEAIASDVLLKKAANFQVSMYAFGKSFDISGMAAFFESPNTREFMARKGILQMIQRGRLESLTDLGVVLNGLRHKTILGIFVTDRTTPEAKRLLSHIASLPDLVIVETEVLAKAIIIHTKDRLEEILKVLSYIQLETRVILFERREIMSGAEIVARIRILSLLHFVEEDILAFVYYLYMKLSKDPDPEKFFAVISAPRLFGILFSDPNRRTKKCASNNEDGCPVTGNSDSQMQRTHHAQDQQRKLSLSKAAISPPPSKNAVNMPPVIVTCNTQKKLVTAVPFRKAKKKAEKKQSPPPKQEFGLAFLE